MVQVERQQRFLIRLIEAEVVLFLQVLDREYH